MRKKRICLLFGGCSSEREISISSANAVYEALDKDKYEILRYDARDDLQKFINDIFAKEFDLVFPLLHGPFGEDGKLQGMLDMLDMPYIFSKTLASALAMDKHKSKLIARNANLEIVPDIVLRQNDNYNIKEIVDILSLPIVIKPNEMGSSIGMTIVQKSGKLAEGIEKGFKYDTTIILEKFIKGRELTVAIFGNNPPKAFPVVEIIPRISKWFDYKAKYEVGGSDEICPAKIPDKICKKVKTLSIEIFKAIGCKDLARVDFIWNTKNKKLYFLEINTIPGMTKTSLVPKAAKAAGMEFGKFLDELIKYAMEAHHSNK
ncbi:MAG: D-alanine--D-alanine ligase [Bacteroidales bacterium]|nr:D-alanine--D-alanine ligase [Bacteroidales bacterium]